ncbi:MAG: response regulator [Desulfobacterales bacterium]|nr:response regulator [Desulfobacterales bacterium]
MSKDIKILIVDDFGTLRRIIRNALKQGGYRDFTEANDGKQALKLLKTDKYDLILSDWNMTEMDGMALLQAVRSDQSLKHIPFLMITAEGSKESVVQAIQSGVSNYIIKPFTPDMLLNKISKVMGD